MARNTSTKETMLTNVRNALITKTKQPFPGIESVDNIYAIADEPLDVLFAQEFIKVNGDFIFCETEAECVEELKNLLIQKEWKSVFCWEPQLHDLFNRFQFNGYSTSNDITQSDASIIMCEALIARTGSLLLSSKQASGRTLPIYPNYNIVIASTKQLMLDLPEGLTWIRKKYDGNLPSMINLATGPSRTADIEKTLVLGAHGPRGVYVFLIDKWPILGLNEPTQ